MLEALEFMRLSRTFEQSSFTDSGIKQSGTVVFIKKQILSFQAVSYAHIVVILMPKQRNCLFESGYVQNVKLSTTEMSMLQIIFFRKV